MYDVYDKLEILMDFLNVGENEIGEFGIWSDDSITYKGNEYELSIEENNSWSNLLGIHHGWFIYQTDNNI